MTMKERVDIRLSGEQTEDALLEQYIDTAADRICLRLGTDSLPAAFETIAADAAVKMHRRRYYEGIRSEPSDSSVTISFVEDVLDEYAAEFAQYIQQQRDGDTERTVKFL